MGTTKKETKATETETETETKVETEAPDKNSAIDPAIPAGVDMEALKAMAREMAKEMVMAERENLIKTAEDKAAEEDAARIAYMEEKIPYTVPYEENDPEDITVRVGNRPLLQIIKGEEVMIPRYAVEVLQRREKMRARARKYEREHNRRDER